MFCVEEEYSHVAWRQAMEMILTHREIFNLVTTISNPTHFGNDWTKVYDPRNYRPGIPSVGDVATTIFPYRYLIRGLPRAEIYSRYIEVHNRAKRIHPRIRGRWGTYFLRFISFGRNGINQLERVINAINNWDRNPKAALYMHVASADSDSLVPIGGPCLQYLEFLCPDRNTVSLLAVYRNHDFFEKALGNYIGLGQLLSFVARETGRQAGEMVCHSAHAYISGGRRDARDLAGL